jgi:hypothetical protein
LARAQAPQGKANVKSAEASAGAQAPPGYDETVRLALREFELENYAEARTGFLKAHRLYPNARTLRALGLVAYEMKNYVTSAEYLSAALSSSERPLTVAQRDEAESVLSRARGYVGSYQISLRPEHARLLVDGQLVDLAPGKLLALSVGDHAIEAQAEGYRPLRRNLEVTGGAEQRLDLVLLALEVKSLASRDGQQNSEAGYATRSEAQPVRKKWWLWATIGAVVLAGAATGLALGTRKTEPSEPTGGTTDAVLRLPAGN